MSRQPALLRSSDNQLLGWLILVHDTGTGEFDDPSLQPYRKIGFDQIRTAAHLALTRKVATKSLVLLENKNNTLPLSPKKKWNIAVVGPFADCQACYYGKYSPHKDASVTTTVAKGLEAGGRNTVTVAGGCSQKKLDEKQQRRRGLQSGCGCVSCPCPSGGGPEPYMCLGYHLYFLVYLYHIKVLNILK